MNVTNADRFIDLTAFDKEEICNRQVNIIKSVFDTAATYCDHYDTRQPRRLVLVY